MAQIIGIILKSRAGSTTPITDNTYIDSSADTYVDLSGNTYKDSPPLASIVYNIPSTGTYRDYVADYTSSFHRVYQPFMIENDTKITQIDISIASAEGYEVTSQNKSITAGIYNTTGTYYAATGSALASKTITPGTVAASYNTISFEDFDFDATGGTVYAVKISAQDAGLNPPPDAEFKISGGTGGIYSSGYENYSSTYPQPGRRLGLQVWGY